MKKTEVKKKIKSLWVGKVGLHEKYINEAFGLGVPLVIVYDRAEQKMTIPPSDLLKGSVSAETYTDRFGQNPYKLIYFPWHPDKDGQAKLF